MATNNVTIKRWNNTAWDVIYPKTTAGNIISGTLSVDRLPTIPVSKLSDIPVTKLVEGAGGEKIDASLLPALAITDVTVSTTQAAFLATYTPNPSIMQEGDVLILTTDNKTFIHNGGELGTMADFNQMATPTDVVTSVAGKTGAVTLVPGNDGLGNVTNHAQMNKIASSTNGYIPTWSGTTGDTLGTGYDISGTGSVAMTNNPAFTGTPSIGTGSNTWTITDLTDDQLQFINGGTIVLPKVSGTKTIAFTDSVPTITGGASTIVTDNLTANMALISNGSGKVVASSTISKAELEYLNGLNVNVQTGKQHFINMGLSSSLPASSTFNGDIYLQTD